MTKSNVSLQSISARFISRSGLGQGRKQQTGSPGRHSSVELSYGSPGTSRKQGDDPSSATPVPESPPVVFQQSKSCVTKEPAITDSTFFSTATAAFMFALDATYRKITGYIYESRPDGSLNLNSFRWPNDYWLVIPDSPASRAYMVAASAKSA